MKKLVAVAALGAASAAEAAWEVNMPVGVTELSRDIHGLHMLIFWVCVVIAVVVFGAMIYALINHRKSRGVEPDRAMLHSTTAEIVWTIIPVVILISMAVPAARTLVKIEDTSESTLTIKATAYQWKWHYEYLDAGVAFYSSLDAESNRARQLDSGISPDAVANYLLEVDNRVVVPVGAKVRMLLTSNDVIHAWWVPDFAVKKDAIPGFVNELWFRVDEAGVYRGQCAELCGKDHGYMPIVVEAVPEAEFSGWLAKRADELGSERRFAKAE